MGAHINKDGIFQSDKYPQCPAGKVPLSIKDKAAQPLLWRYAQTHRLIDAELSDDLETALRAAGYSPPVMRLEDCVAELRESLKECVGAGTEHYDEGEPPGLFQLGYQSESGAIEIDFEAQAICDRARAAISRSDR